MRNYQSARVAVQRLAACLHASTPKQTLPPKLMMAPANMSPCPGAQISMKPATAIAMPLTKTPGRLRSRPLPPRMFFNPLICPTPFRAASERSERVHPRCPKNTIRLADGSGENWAPLAIIKVNSLAGTGVVVPVHMLDSVLPDIICHDKHARQRERQPEYNYPPSLSKQKQQISNRCHSHASIKMVHTVKGLHLVTPCGKFGTALTGAPVPAFTSSATSKGALP